MSFVIHSQKSIGGLSAQRAISVLMQSYAAAGRYSIANTDNGFDAQVTLAETKGWQDTPKNVSFLGSMGRIAGHGKYDATGLKGEGISLAGDENAYVVHVDGTAESIDDETPLSLYAGVNAFNPSQRAEVTFDTMADVEKALDKLTGGKPAWVRITIPRKIISSADVKNRSVPGGTDSGLPLTEPGKIQTIFAEETSQQNVTFEGYYLPRGAVAPQDGVYYGLQDGQPGFLHVHALPSDVSEDRKLAEYNAAIEAQNAESDEVHSIGGHTLSISNAEHAVIDIMPVEAGFIKAGMNGARTKMRPMVQNRDLEWETRLVEAVQNDAGEHGVELSEEQIRDILEQHILDRDAAVHMLAGKDVPETAPSVEIEMRKHVDLITSRTDEREAMQAPQYAKYFGLDQS